MTIELILAKKLAALALCVDEECHNLPPAERIAIASSMHNQARLLAGNSAGEIYDLPFEDDPDYSVKHAYQRGFADGSSGQ